MPVFVPQRKRNARGERRVASLLDAAARVFDKLGYQQATTNAIAAEAGVSPATLYQFFPNREAIADALATRYAVLMANQQKSQDLEELQSIPLERMVQAFLDPVIGFHLENPVFRTLLTEATLSKSAKRQKQLLSQTFIDRLASLLLRKNPRMRRAEAHWNADVCLTVLKAFLPLIAGTSAAGRKKSVQALNDLVVRFLKPLLP
jgi:AcrR family transcriptional regulator